MKAIFNLSLLLLLLTFVSTGEARVIKALEDLTFDVPTGNNIIMSAPSLTVSQPLKLGSSKELVTGAIDLTTEVTGTLPVANGGTGSAIQNFVDLTTTQYISGTKFFRNKLSVESTTETSLPCPVMTNTQRDATTAITGDCVYNSTTSALNVYNGTIWTAVGSGGGGGLAEWATSTGYAADEVIFTDGKIYLALNSHTSGTFATDLTNGEWIELSASLQNLSAVNGELLVGNGSGYVSATLTGTLNQVEVTNGSGSITLGLPQDIETTSSPTFVSATFSGVLTNAFLKSNASGGLDSVTAIDLTTDVTGTLPIANGGTGSSLPFSAGQYTSATLPSVATYDGFIAYDTTNDVYKYSDGSSWLELGGGGGGAGDLVGPASATDNAIPRFDTTTGKLVQDSNVLISDADAMEGLTSVIVSGSVTTTIPLEIYGVASQTANLFQINDSTGADMMHLEADGTLRTALRSSTSDGFSIAPVDGASNHGIIFNGTGNSSNVTMRAANSAYATLSGNGLLISGVGVYAIRSGLRGLVTGPAYTFDNDRDTGIFSDSANLLSLAAGATVALTATDTEVQVKHPVEFADNETVTTPPSGEITLSNDDEIFKVTNSSGIESPLVPPVTSQALINTSFEDDVAGNGWTITSGTPSVELTAVLPSEGTQALKVAVSASAFEMYQTFDCSDFDSIC